MMQQQPEWQDQTNPILPLTPGFAEPLTYDHQWVFPLLDTPYSDLQAEAHRVEEEEDSPVEVEAVFQEEEEVDSQAEEEDNFLNQEIRTQETD